MIPINAGGLVTKEFLDDLEVLGDMIADKLGEIKKKHGIEKIEIMNSLWHGLAFQLPNSCRDGITKEIIEVSDCETLWRNRNEFEKSRGKAGNPNNDNILLNLGNCLYYSKAAFKRAIKDEDYITADKIKKELEGCNVDFDALMNEGLTSFDKIVLDEKKFASFLKGLPNRQRL